MKRSELLLGTLVGVCLSVTVWGTTYAWNKESQAAGREILIMDMMTEARREPLHLTRLTNVQKPPAESSSNEDLDRLRINRGDLFAVACPDKNIAVVPEWSLRIVKNLEPVGNDERQFSWEERGGIQQGALIRKISEIGDQYLVRYEIPHPTYGIALPDGAIFLMPKAEFEHFTERYRELRNREIDEKRQVQLALLNAESVKKVDSTPW